MQEEYQQIIEYTLRILSKKRYTIEEIRKKILKYCSKREFENIEELSEKVLDRLKELNYLNDQKFIDDYVQNRINLSPRGHLLIKRELTLKGVKEDLIDKKFRKDLFDEFIVAKNLLMKKAHKWKNDIMIKQRQKAYRLLASKGFRVDTIYSVLNTCYNHT